jgi:hypothetical protein
MAEVTTKVCYTCKIEKSIDEFYRSKINKDGHMGSCIKCIKKKEEGYNEFKDSTEIVPMNPGEYNSESQKEQTFKLLLAIGWKFDRITKIWYKSPLKNRYGDWRFPKKKRKSKEFRGKHEHIHRENRRKEMAKRPEKYKPRKRLGDRGLDQKQQEDIRKQYQEKKMTQQKLADKYNVAVSYINCILHFRT